MAIRYGPVLRHTEKFVGPTVVLLLTQRCERWAHARYGFDILLLKRRRIVVLVAIVSQFTHAVQRRRARRPVIQPRFGFELLVGRQRREEAMST